MIVVVVEKVRAPFSGVDAVRTIMVHGSIAVSRCMMQELGLTFALKNYHLYRLGSRLSNTKVSSGHTCCRSHKNAATDSPAKHIRDD